MICASMVMDALNTPMGLCTGVVCLVVLGLYDLCMVVVTLEHKRGLRLCYVLCQIQNGVCGHHYAGLVKVIIGNPKYVGCDVNLKGAVCSNEMHPC